MTVADLIEKLICFEPTTEVVLEYETIGENEQGWYAVEIVEPVKYTRGKKTENFINIAHNQ